ncbi:ATP-binding protein [Acrocarpospora sp. B8E8]|uniref:ATP-binding protein n=1 Tax=Acrocarpospora sp. B8E8 TaxID=3153572 RepID=UPI00325CF648
MRPRHKTPAQWQNPAVEVEITTAIVDRLTFNATIIETGTDSYRLARTRAQQDSNAT